MCKVANQGLILFVTFAMLLSFAIADIRIPKIVLLMDTSLLWNITKRYRIS